MTSVRTIHQTLTRHDRAFERIDNRAFHRSQIPVTINRAIPMKARKGQKYIFLDGHPKFRVRQKDVRVYPDLLEKFPEFEDIINRVKGVEVGTGTGDILDTPPPPKPDDIPKPLPIPTSYSGDAAMLPTAGAVNEALSMNSFTPVFLPTPYEVGKEKGAITYEIFSPERYFDVNCHEPVCVEILRTGNPLDYTKDIKVTRLSRAAAFETARAFTRVENWKKYNYRTIDRSEVFGESKESGMRDVFAEHHFDVYYFKRCLSKKLKDPVKGYKEDNIASRREYIAWKRLSNNKFSENLPVGRSVRLRVRVYPSKRQRRRYNARVNSNYIEGIMLIRKREQDGQEYIYFSLIH